jgi:pSer/pThr/pTyr-binding forkhead associated (FHA) protein
MMVCGATRRSAERTRMALITLRILDGADRGRVFSGLPTPVTIGREEGNSLQLNDERVSRFHLKIQEDQNQFVLTDLDSTNGTKVNGEDAQLRILRYGDIISVGRSVVLFGSRQEIAERLLSAQPGDPNGRTMVSDELRKQAAEASLDFEENWNDRLHEAAERKVKTPPELPTKLTPLQAAHLCEVFEFIHVRLRDVLGSMKDEQQHRITVADKPWQNLIDLQWRLAEYIRNVAEPKEPEDDD